MVVALKPLYDALAHQARRGVHLPGRFRRRRARTMAELYDQTRAFLDGTPEDELEISAFAHQHRLQHHPAHRRLPGRRLHQRGVEDGRRDQEDHAS